MSGEKGTETIVINQGEQFYGPLSNGGSAIVFNETHSEILEQAGIATEQDTVHAQNENRLKKIVRLTPERIIQVLRDKSKPEQRAQMLNALSQQSRTSLPSNAYTSMLENSQLLQRFSAEPKKVKTISERIRWNQSGLKDGMNQLPLFLQIQKELEPEVPTTDKGYGGGFMQMMEKQMFTESAGTKTPIDWNERLQVADQIVRELPVLDQ